MKPYQINEDYRITTDEHSWVLEKRSVLKKSKKYPEKVGTESWTPISWFPYLHQLVTTASRRLVHDSGHELPRAVHDACSALRGLVEHVRRETEGRKIP